MLGKMQSPNVPYAHVRHLPIAVTEVAVVAVIVVSVAVLVVSVAVDVVVDVVSGSVQR